MQPRILAHFPSLHLARMAAVAVAAALTFALALADSADAATKPTGKTALGVFSDSASAGVKGYHAFSRFSPAPIQHVLDFLPSNNWRSLTFPRWVVRAHENQPYTLELSVPMLPREGKADLYACSAGVYNKHWRRLAQGIAAETKRTVFIRPGWEFNGTWYRWSAVGKAGAYKGCYRQLVTTMRKVAGRQFRFVWNPNINDAAMPAEKAYPGDRYVNYVSIDVYDYGWHYGNKKLTKLQASRKMWQQRLDGSRGLRFWSKFSKTHHKPMALSEWGVAWRADGRAGGDNVYFLNRMMDFISNRRSGVAYATFFNDMNSGLIRHQVVASGRTKFPRVARALAHRLRQFS